jgi:integrase
VFTSGELSALQKACAGRTFAQRRDAAIIAVFRATRIRLAELAAIRYDPDDTQRSAIDLWQREITVRGKAGNARIVRIGHQAAVTLDRYLRTRPRHTPPQARGPDHARVPRRGPARDRAKITGSGHAGQREQRDRVAGKTTKVRLHPGDLYASDEFWS